VPFSRTVALAAGSYVVDAAVHDRLASRFGSTYTRLNVPPRADVQVSDVVLVMHGERLSGGRRPDSPLLMGEVFLHPSLGEPIEQSDVVLLYFTVLNPSKVVLKATLTIVKHGRSVAERLLSLSAPDSDGNIRQLVEIRTASLEPGPYDISVEVTTPATSIKRHSVLEIGARR